MIFITFAMMDYGLQGVLGMFVYLNYFEQQEKQYEWSKLKDESKYIGLAIAGLSGLLLLFILPIWLVQVLNLIRGGPKNKSDKRLVSSSNSFGETSDTGSMLVRPSSDWNPASFTNQASFLVSKKFEEPETGCCYKKLHNETGGVSMGKQI